MLSEIQEKMIGINKQRRGSFSEYLVYKFYQQINKQPKFIHKGLLDLKTIDKLIDVKSNIKYISTSFNDKLRLSSNFRRHSNKFCYEQVLYFNDFVVLINDFQKEGSKNILKKWDWKDIEINFNTWSNNKEEKLVLNSEDSFGEKLKKEILIWWAGVDENSKIKVIQRGGHKWSKSAQPFNSFPSEKELLEKKLTVYIKWDVDDMGIDHLNYIISFPHNKKSIELLPKYIPTYDYIRKKGVKYLIDFHKIEENNKAGSWKDFYFENLNSFKSEVIGRFSINSA